MPGEPAQKTTQPEEANPTPDRAEPANVLFMDMVGYSKVPTDEQGALVDKLQSMGRRLLFNRDGRIWLVDKDKPERAKEILSVAPDEVVRRGLGIRNDRSIYFSREKIRSKIFGGTLP